MNSGFLEVKIPQGGKIAVIGDIHEHPEQFYKMLEKISPSSSVRLVSVGDCYNKGFGKKSADEMTDTLRDLWKENIAYAVPGNHELRLIRKAEKDKIELSKQLKWWNKLPLTVSFLFEQSGTRVTILHGGVTKNHTWKDLHDNTEICYIRTLDKNGEYIKLEKIKNANGESTMKPSSVGVSWHETYDGRFGYIAAGHDAQHDGVPKFYKYSCNLDTACYSTGNLTCQIFGSDGLEQLIMVKGKAATPGKRYWTP